MLLCSIVRFYGCGTDKEQTPSCEWRELLKAVSFTACWCTQSISKHTSTLIFLVALAGACFSWFSVLRSACGLLQQPARPSCSGPPVASGIAALVWTMEGRPRICTIWSFFQTMRNRACRLCIFGTIRRQQTLSWLLRGLSVAGEHFYATSGERFFLAQPSSCKTNIFAWAQVSNSKVCKC